MYTHTHTHTHTQTYTLSSFKGFAMLATTHGQPPTVRCTSNCHITFNAFDCYKMISKHQFQSTELKIIGCEVCQIQWMRQECNLFFHQKMLSCHSPVTLWGSINPLHNISDSFLLTLSCKLDSTST